MFDRIAALFPLMFMLYGIASGQAKGDVCRVTVTDVKKYESAMRAVTSKATDAEAVRLIRLSTKDVGSFVTDVGFQRETRKALPFPGSNLLISAAVSYSHAESRAADNYAPTVRVELSVTEGRKGGRQLASAASETSYSQFTDFVTTQTWLTVRGRLYDVTVDCRRHDEK